MDEYSHMGLDVELEDGKATPFTLILALYDAQLVLEQCEWHRLDFLEQCAMLQADKISSKSKRKSLIQELIQDSDFHALHEKSYVRIRLKSVLAQFHRESSMLHSLSNISEWSGHLLLVSFISYLISIATDKENKKAAAHKKVWHFVDFLRRYFRDERYDGKAFMATFEENDKAKPGESKGFGLTMMRNICSRYDLKSGPYSKVKKQCNIWALKLHEQSKTNKQAHVQMSDASKPNNHQNHASAVQHIVHQNHDQHNGHGDYHHDCKQTENTASLNGKCWYWLCDDNGLRWIPYREKDAEILNAAWRNQEKHAFVKDGTYRVVFCHVNPEEPCGHQFNNNIANPNGRIVKCEVPNSVIFGINVQSNPL